MFIIKFWSCSGFKYNTLGYQHHRQFKFNQGRNQVCSQRWARLDNFPPNVRFGTPKTNFSDFTKWQAKKENKKEKKRKEKVLCSISYLSPSSSKFFSSPFTVSHLFLSIFPSFIVSLFPFLLFFPLPSPFPPSPFLPKFPPNFPRVGESPTLPTLSYATDFNATSFAWIWQRSGVIVFWWKIYH